MLNYYQCLRLLDACVVHGLIQQDVRCENNIIVYMMEGKNNKEGYYSQNIFSAASDLLQSEDGQKCLMDAIKEHTGEDFIPPELPVFDLPALFEFDNVSNSDTDMSNAKCKASSHNKVKVRRCIKRERRTKPYPHTEKIAYSERKECKRVAPRKNNRRFLCIQT